MRGKYGVCLLLVFVCLSFGWARGEQVLPIAPAGTDGEPALLDPTIAAPTTVAVPEPGTIAMLLLGGTLSSLMAIRRNRHR